MIQKISSIVLFLFLNVCNTPTTNTLQIIGQLPRELNENSGMVWLHQHLWMVNDSGNTNHIFKLDQKGNIKARIEVKNAQNIDWEDVATDTKNNIYIGDFGNNDNNREDLKIYTIDINKINKSSVTASTIAFTLADQDDFSPKKKNRNFDIEAFVYFKKGFYLFTKNRSSKFDGVSKVYRLELNQPQQVAKLVAEINLCDNLQTCQVTGAAIFKNKIVLLMHDKIYELQDFEVHKFSKIRPIALSHNSQKEAICFRNESILFISDEKKDKKPAQLYQFNLQKTTQ